jgi:hypothetical protein
MINEVREYFKNRINEVNSDMVEHDDPFDDQIPESIIEDVYTIKIGEIKSDFVNQTVEDQMPVEIKVFKKGDNDVLENFYQFYQEAHMIRLCAIDPVFSRNGNYIKNVICEGIVPSRKEGGDNLIVYSLQFKILLSFGLNYT